ncbi:MAG TPA: protein kinase, partial [Planctomycetota bacterium]|nr:protein kinase [Planctomycetota bacterium]
MTDVKPQRAGAYRIVARLPGGGDGVFLAEGRHGRRVVLKLCERGADERQGLAELALLGLRHPGLAACLDAGRLLDDGRLYTVSEYVAGQPLGPAALPWPRPRPDAAVRLCAQLLAALGALHDRGRLHRDLKPANVLLESASGRPVILDFGLGCAIGESAGAPSAGTPAAMAPELFRGDPATPASDLWAAGLLLSECLLGRRLFRAEEPEGMAREREAFAGFA